MTLRKFTRGAKPQDSCCLLTIVGILAALGGIAGAIGSLFGRKKRQTNGHRHPRRTSFSQE